ncbi:hypothetical protein [Cohnella silvisoli]|uniref:NodB homology domain-containing protein n=1 Tax=Cohnella silvisoli TaxID=2873699 RepID=A0ABV1L0J9_9BACL|nr:hypothetical protein [Cohnella silvisoli]MCD9025129.1 hypothetical protein [Cohnella silvisoli]
MRMARVGVLVDERMTAKRRRYGLNTFEGYITEILAHVGIPHQLLHSLREWNGNDWDVLIVALEDDDPADLERFYHWAESGGIVISYGGLDKLADKLACVRLRSLNEAYAHLPPASSGSYPPLRAFRVTPWTTPDASNIRIEAYGQVSERSPDAARDFDLLQRFAIGQGTIERFSVNIPAAIVALQQGLEPVLKDGLPAADGSASLNEGILKADDGMALDWEWDRLHTETGQAYFAYPYADYWREVCIGHLLEAVVNRGMTLPFIGYWPDGVNSVATISHDSDGNLDEHAWSTLDLLQQNQVQTTWCMLEPGYSASVYRRIEQDGHELAFHYNSLHLDNQIWDQTEFNRQLRWLQDAATVNQIRTNKNHYTRFEGWGELFRWYEEAGIVVDQTRGPSKGGNVGFLFGTCHPFFPIAWSDEDNRLYEVLEIGFLTQDMGIGPPWADDSIIAPFLAHTMRVEGVAHFLFHQVHIHTKPAVVEAFNRVVREARQAGFVFWTSAQIYEWEMRRRQIRITGVDEAGRTLVEDGTASSDAVVWVPIHANEVKQGDEEVRFGVRCLKQVVTAASRGE